jgi:bacillithiol biosynthesis cysteine-adding enzyme BshC
VPGPFSPPFLNGEPRAERFLRATFRDAKARIEHTKRVSARRLAPGLIEAIREQDRWLPASEQRKANLAKLVRPGTTVVVTGQQVGLFLGPLYTFYKAASAVAVAAALERESGVPCVPLFWVQTEDHDFPEINHCNVPGADGTALRLAIDETLEGPDSSRVSAKHRVVGNDVGEQLDCLDQQFASLPQAAEFLGLLRDQYRPGRSMSQAFACTLAAVFSSEGLVLLDPRTETVAKLVAPIHRKAIREAEDIANRLLQRCRELGASDFEIQVHVRAGSPLSFFHYPNIEGPRFRLEPAAAGWTLVGREQSVSSEELLALLETEPMRFSSSALLRPLLQDTLLPTAAYVAGPGEINYFAQLEPLYADFKLPVPMIVPRARFRCLEARIRALLEKLHLAPAQVEHPRDQLLTSLPSEPSGDYPPPEVVQEQLLGGVSRRLDELDKVMASLDPNLSKAVLRTRETVTHAISRLVQRYQHALVEKNQMLSERIDRAQAFLYPSGEPQERVYSLPYFACRYGIGELKRKVFARLVPFSGEVVDLDL